LKSGIELPGETRGLVKPPSRWQPTTIGSIPMGQEIAVTPIQLVSMASAIANGGTYLPPHIVLESTSDMKANGSLKPAVFHPTSELPSVLPAGAHRVISEMTAAQMRQMMEGVVLFGTGRPAQLDGYSAGGKTGTAQKIDPKTHTYSKTKYVASFVGFAPVNSPAVTIAVVMDSPTKGSHFGTAVSAPVFHELAQQILEYLGVPHDQDLKATNLTAKDSPPVEEEPAQEETADLQSLFAEANHLPADDPLSTDAANSPVPAETAKASVPPVDFAPNPVGTGTPQMAHADVPPIIVAPATVASQANLPPVSGGAQLMQIAAARMENGSVSIPNSQVAVPSFAGKSLRAVVVQASAAGLGVQVVGSGLARDQAPVAGTMVAVGTEIVVRFTP
jgi:cell division protein FtsI (penicillin-binding protein 3)